MSLNDNQNEYFTFCDVKAHVKGCHIAEARAV